MKIADPHYKTQPEFIQFSEGASDYRREADARRQRGLKRAPDVPMWLLETGRSAGLTHAEMRSALGISSNTLSAALKNFGIVLPRSNRDRVRALSKSPIVPDESASSATGMVEAWLTTEVIAPADQSGNVDPSAARTPLSSDREPKRRLKATELAETVAKKLIGETADRLVPGTFTGRDGYERCDGLSGKGPEARPLRYAWRDKAAEVEAVFKIARELQSAA